MVWLSTGFALPIFPDTGSIFWCSILALAVSRSHELALQALILDFCKELREGIRAEREKLSTCNSTKWCRQRLKGRCGWVMFTTGGFTPDVAVMVIGNVYADYRCYPSIQQNYIPVRDLGLHWCRRELEVDPEGRRRIGLPNWRWRRIEQLQHTHLHLLLLRSRCSQM